MRAHTITPTTRRARSARRRVIALVLGVCALAIPASASAMSAVPQVPHGAAYSSFSVTPPPTSEPTVAQSAPGSPNAIVGNEGGQPSGNLVSYSPSDSADGFDWGDAALGAGAAMGLIALSGAVLFTVRRRPSVSPSAWTG